MLELLGIVVGIYLNILIFWRLPKKNVGLAAFTEKINLGSLEHLLNVVTMIFIIVFLEITIKLNLQEINF